MNAKSAPRKKAGRTESLSLRLEPRTKFLLDLLARVEDTSITKVVERAIREKADRTFSSYNGEYRFDWSDLWHVDEGVQKIKLLSQYYLRGFLDFEEEQLLDFLQKHWPFFSTTPNFNNLQEHYIFVLWPEIHDFLSHWEKNKTKDVWSTGKLMSEKIAQAGMAVPAWPHSAANAASTSFVSSAPEFEDEIPF